MRVVCAGLGVMPGVVWFFLKSALLEGAFSRAKLAQVGEKYMEVPPALAICLPRM